MFGIENKEKNRFKFSTFYFLLVELFFLLIKN